MTGALYTGAVGLPFVSTLRVYEPLEAFSETDQAALLAEAQGTPDREELERRELAGSLGRITRSGPDPFPTGSTEGVRTLRMSPNAPLLFCPNQLVLRAGMAADSLSENVAGPLADLLIPESSKEEHRERVQRLVGAATDKRIHSRSSTWGIPFSWFVLVHETDRTEVLEVDGRVATVRVSVPVQEALERARFVIASLALAAPELDMLDDVTQLTEWLELFHPGSVVELDYGAVADKVFPDESPMDVRLGVECLTEGDMTGAAAAYRRLASRWIPIRQLARAS